jgi:hypothetical protein
MKSTAIYYGYNPYNNGDAIYFIECHSKGDEFVLDNIGKPLKIKKGNGPE